MTSDEAGQIIYLAREAGGMKSKCENCKRRIYAMQHPNSFRARLWNWHTKWCPGWKAYLKEKQTEIK